MEEIVEARGLSYVYPDGTRALDGVSFSVGRGESVGILGPNGSGKSTLLLTLVGILRGEGKVRLLGLPVIPKWFREIRARVGYVFQNPDDQLFCPTVLEDVAFGPLNQGLPPAEVEARVKRTLARVGLDGYEQRLPQNLSYGEKKRAALATVLAMNPELLLLDEPFEGLDYRGRKVFFGLLRELPVPKIIVSHNSDLIQGLCSRVIILDGGRVVAEGETLDIMGDTEFLESHGIEPPQNPNGGGERDGKSDLR